MTTANNDDNTDNQNGEISASSFYGKWYLKGFGSSPSSMGAWTLTDEYMDFSIDGQMVWGGQLGGRSDLYTYTYRDKKIYIVPQTSNGDNTYFEIYSFNPTEMVLYQPSSKSYRRWVKE